MITIEEHYDRVHGSGAFKRRTGVGSASVSSMPTAPSTSGSRSPTFASLASRIMSPTSEFPASEAPALPMQPVLRAPLARPAILPSMQPALQVPSRPAILPPAQPALRAPLAQPAIMPPAQPALQAPLARPAILPPAQPALRAPLAQPAIMPPAPGNLGGGRRKRTSKSGGRKFFNILAQNRNFYD